MTEIIIFTALPTAIFIIAAIAISVYNKKRLQEIREELDLEEGAKYDAILNNGSKMLNLTFTSIGYGKQSQNGRINLYFLKDTKYRGSYYQKEVMIKYGNIWKLNKISQSVTVSIHREENQ